MLNSSKNKRSETLKKNLEKHYFLLGKWEEKLLVETIPPKIMECEIEIEKLKKKITDIEQELIETETNPNPHYNNQSEPNTSIKNIIIGILAFAIISLAVYSIYTFNNSKTEAEKVNDSVTIKNDSIAGPIEVQPVCKTLKIKLKTSSEQCGSQDFKIFPSGKIYLNIWVSKPLKTKLKISWGDGLEDIITSSKSDCYTITHTYLSLNKKEIIVYLVCENNKIIPLASKKITIQSI